MSSTPEDLTSPASGGEAVRVDAPPAPSSMSAAVSSEPAGPAPPRRSKRSTSAPPMVAASVPVDTADPVADTVLTEDDEDGQERARRPRRNRSRAVTASPRPTLAPRNERRFRQTVVKVDLWSVTKLALCFYLSAMFVTLVALIALWVIADAAGIIHSVEKFLGDLLSAKDFTFLSGEVLRGTILIGLVVVALQVVITVVAASFYNIFSELFGGLEITVKEEDATPR
jgi:hypothetical protein